MIGPGRLGFGRPLARHPGEVERHLRVRAVVETAIPRVSGQTRPRGSHFFHNITSLDISYLTTFGNGEDFADWDWLKAQPAAAETRYLRHVRLDRPLTLKIDGKKTQAVILP